MPILRKFTMTASPSLWLDDSWQEVPLKQHCQDKQIQCQIISYQRKQEFQSLAKSCRMDDFHMSIFLPLECGKNFHFSA